MSVDRPPPPRPPGSTEDVRHMRAEPRDSMFLLATVRRLRGPDIPVKVRNLSPGGMMAEFGGGLIRGDAVEVDLRGIGTVTGKVAWIAPGRLGVQFDDPVDHRLARVAPGAPAAAQPQLVRASRTSWRPGLR